MADSLFNTIEIIGMVTSMPKNQEEVIDKNNQKYLLRRSNKSQATSDFGFHAAKYILNKKKVDIEEVGTLIFSSKTPDYRGPATSIVLQGRLGLTKDCIAYDINIGSCGFVFGSQIVCSNLKSINKKYGLLIIGDTTSKQLIENSELKFSDGATAILFEKREEGNPIRINTKSYSKYYKDYMIQKGGFREFSRSENGEIKYDRSLKDNFLEINESKYSNFIKSEVLANIEEYFEINNLSSNNLDALVIHQFNEESLGLFKENFKYDFKFSDEIFANFTNVNSNTIPLVLSKILNGNDNENKRVLASAYGEGFTFGLMDFYIKPNNVYAVIETDEYFKEGIISHQ